MLAAPLPTVVAREAVMLAMTQEAALQTVALQTTVVLTLPPLHLQLEHATRMLAAFHLTLPVAT